MRKSQIYLTITLVLLAFAIFASASVLADSNVTMDNNSTVTISPAISAEVNDSLDGTVSSSTMGWENFKLWFTFNNEARANQELRIARLRLIQAKVAALNGDNETMQAALDAHDKLIDDIKARVNSIDNNSAEKFVGLERAIEVHEARISRLNEIIANANLTDEQRTRIETRLSQVENNTAKLREIESNKLDRIKERIKENTNLTDEEIDLRIQKFEDKENLTSIRRAIIEVKLDRAKLVLNNIKERLASRNMTKVDDRIEKVENRIGMIRDRYSKNQTG